MRNSSIYSRPLLSSRRSVRPEDSRKGRPNAPNLAGSLGGNIGFSDTDIYYALLGQILAVPPAAAERLKQGCGIAQARGTRLHDLKGCLQIGLLRSEQNENIGIAGLHLLLREIETHLGGTLEITRRFQCVGIIVNRVQRICDILDRTNHRACISPSRRLIGIFGALQLMQQRAAVEHRLGRITGQYPEQILWREQMRKSSIDVATVGVDREARK